MSLGDKGVFIADQPHTLYWQTDTHLLHRSYIMFNSLRHGRINRTKLESLHNQFRRFSVPFLAQLLLSRTANNGYDTAVWGEFT